MKKSLLFAVTAVLFAAGCGPQPLEVWRVSAIAGQQPDTCFIDGIPPRESMQTGAQVDMGAWEIYEGPEDKFFLSGAALGSAGDASDNGYHTGATLEGTLGDDRYTFDVTETFVSKNKPAGATKIETSTLQTTITLNMDGDTFTGTWKEQRTYKCEGSECPPSFTAEHPNCTVEHQLRGAKVEADNLHVVNSGN